MKKQLLFFIIFIITFLVVPNNKCKAHNASRVNVTARVLEEITYSKADNVFKANQNTKLRSVVISKDNKIIIISEF